MNTKYITAIINGRIGTLVLTNKLKDNRSRCKGCIFNGTNYCLTDITNFIKINGDCVTSKDCDNVFGSNYVVNGLYYNEFKDLDLCSSIRNNFCKDTCIYNENKGSKIFMCRVYSRHNGTCPLEFLLDELYGSDE